MSRSGLLEKIELAPKGRSHSDWLDYWTSSCESDYAVFLDSDVEILNEFWLERLVLVAEAEGCALVTSEILNQSATAYRDFTGVTRRLYPRPAPWMVLIRPDVCRTMGSWKFFILNDTTIKEGAWAYDSGSLIYQNLLAESKIVKAMDKNFIKFFRHYGGFSWVAKTKAKGVRAILNKFRVRLLKFVVIVKVLLLHFKSNR
jgi:glycosyltransferase involved in cell wall biosynthesis